MSKIKRDYSQQLIWAALVVTVARYMGAFVASEVGQINGWLSEAITIMVALSGAGMGFLDVIGLAYIFEGWRKALPKSGGKWSYRYKILTGFVVGLFATGLMILVPFTISRVTHASIATVLGPWALWLWALAVNVAPYLVIGGVVASTSGVVAIDSGNERNPAPASRQDSGKIPAKVESKTWADLSHADIVAVVNYPSGKVAEKFGVSERTARNWRARGKEYLTERAQ